MADKGNGRRPAGQDLEASSPDQIRNVVLVGPGGSGKTTLVETLLATAGAVPRAGSVRTGAPSATSIPASSSTAAPAPSPSRPLVHEGTKVNLIDTPGYADFVGDLRAGLRAADCALFVIAANEGVDDGTRNVWRECAEVGMPRAVVITKLDQARADYDGVLAQAQESFGDKVKPLYVPVREGGAVTALTGLLEPCDGRPGRAARRPDRGRDRGVRGRDPHGPLPRRRGDRRQAAGRRPRAGRRAGDVLPRRTGLLGHRHRLRRAARPGDQRIPLPGRAPVTRRVHGRRCSRARASPATPMRTAGRRGHQDHERPVRRPAQPGAGLQRHAAARRLGARVRPLLVVLRRGVAAIPTTTRTSGSARCPTPSASSWCPPPRSSPETSPRSGGSAAPRPATRCPTSTTRSSSSRGACPSRCSPPRSSRARSPTRTSSPRPSAGSPPRTRPSGSRTTPRPTSWCCGASARRTPT